MKKTTLFMSILQKGFVAILITLMFSSCVTFFYPKKEKVTFSTGNKESTVYIDKSKAGKGTTVTEKVEKKGAHQVVIKTPGYKDTYTALIQNHRAPGFWACIFFDVPGSVFFGYPILVDLMVLKGVSYDNQVIVKPGDKIVNRDPADKYIDISNIGIDLKAKDKTSAILYYVFTKGGDPMKAIDAAEKKYDEKTAKEELKKAKKKKKGNDLDENEDVTASDTKFSDNVYNTLKKTGYIDTVNKVFSDNNNTLVLEGSIKKISEYRIGTNARKYWYWGHYYKSRLSIRWYIKNTYNEILDSVDTKEFSGDFVWTDDKDFYTKMYGDAVDASYLRLQKEGKLTKYMKMETNFKTNDAALSIPPINSSGVIGDKGDAAEASVIIKRQDKGHGSGFAISQNGYIITNYHVIAGKVAGKLSPIKVITSTGEELDATVVRYNKFRDLALIKVNKNFEKAFKVSSTKSFKNMQDVYTIGAPKSIELGQSVSTGLISNERKTNNNNLLQLGMSVNAGNSGGPVFDTQGNLHGVIVSKLIGANTEGVSFAIPGYLIPEYLNINYSGSAPASAPAKKK